MLSFHHLVYETGLAAQAEANAVKMTEWIAAVYVLLSEEDVEEFEKR